MTLTITIPQRAAPGDDDFVAIAQTKAIFLQWGRQDTDIFKWINVYRYATSSDAIADTSGTLIASVTTDQYYDSSNLTLGEDYYYRLAGVDFAENESAKCDPVSAVYTGIGSADLDQTPPSAPGTPTVANFTGDIDLDGAVDTGLTVTWTAPASGVVPNYYVLEIYRSATVGTTSSLTGYTLWQVLPVLSGLTATIFANAAKYHKVVVKGVSVAGVTGTGSAANSVGIKPQGFPALLSTVSWVTASGLVQPIVAQPKAIQLRWIKSTSAQYKETVIYRHTSNSSGSAVEVGRVSGDRWTDHDGLVNGTTYYYWLKDADKAGDLSASFSSVQSIAYRAAAADTGTGDYDTTALSAPGSPALAQDNRDLNGDGVVDMACTYSWSAVTNAVRYEVEVSSSTTAGGTYTVLGIGGTTPGLKFTFPVNTAYYYKARVRAVNAFGVPGTWTSLSSALQPVKRSTAPSTPTNLVLSGGVMGITMKWDLSADPDYWYTEIWMHTTNSFTGGATLRAVVAGNLYNFVEASNTQYYVWIYHVNKSGVKSARLPATNTTTYTWTTTLITKDEISDGAIVHSKLDSGLAKSINALTGANGSFLRITGTTTAVMQDIVGTVSQSSGTPTGAILEYGSNANGQYIRFADGTQKCWGVVSITPVANTPTSGAVTYPAAFASAPNLQVSVNTTSPGTSVLGISVSANTSSGCSAYITRTTTAATSIYWEATGRWY